MLKTPNAGVARKLSMPKTIRMLRKYVICIYNDGAGRRVMKITAAKEPRTSYLTIIDNVMLFSTRNIAITALTQCCD